MNPARLLTHPILWSAIVLGALTALWLALGAPVSLITQIAIYTLYGAGVNLLVGYTGLVPFGASVFFGTASYAMAFALQGGLSNTFVALAASVVFSALLGLVIGAVILRRTGLYFSLLTLAFSQIAFEVAFKWTGLTGGENGIQGLPRPHFESPLAYHGFVVVTVLAALWFLWALAHAPFGRVIQAVRDNAARASSLGINIFLVRLGALVLTAAVVGYAGALLTLLLQGVYADNLSWQHAGDSLLMVVLGGVHHVFGPLWGAIAFILLENRLSAITENWWLIFAPILMAFALLSPEGIHGLAQRLLRRERWTLVRHSTPARPSVIPAYKSKAAAMEPGKPVLEVKKLSKSFGSLVTARNIDLQIFPGTLHGIIGPNGAGKTTFFNMLTGVLAPSGGTILLDGQEITRLAVHKRAQLGISRSFQILSIFPNLTVFENVRVAVQVQRGGAFGLLRDAHRNEEINLRAWSILDAVGLADKAAEPCATLPHGAKRLLEIAVTLAVDCKVLLLDEPLAGLAEADRVIVAKLIKTLSKDHAVVLIEHDIDRVLAISDTLSVLHQGRIVAQGEPKAVAANPEVIAAYLGRERDAEAPKAPPRTRSSVEGPILLEVEGLEVGYGGSTVLSGVSLTVREGECLALLGRNGVGKTTTLRALTGSLPLKSGAIRFNGHDLARLKPYQINRLGMSLVPEGRRCFPNLTVTENLQLAARAGGISLNEVFTLFPRLKTRQNARAENLSGGERQMVAIARALMVPSRLILLDEPFEGLAPAVVDEVMDALIKLRGKVAMVLVEHHAESVLPLADKACVLVNGQIAFAGDASTLEEDHDLQARLLGVVQAEETPTAA